MVYTIAPYNLLQLLPCAGFQLRSQLNPFPTEVLSQHLQLLPSPCCAVSMNRQPTSPHEKGAAVLYHLTTAELSLPQTPPPRTVAAAAAAAPPATAAVPAACS
jgi:hypothetical protein